MRTRRGTGTGADMSSVLVDFLWFCSPRLVYAARGKEVLSMFRFAKAVDLQDETSWSAWGTRRRRPARPADSHKNQRAAERT